MVTVLAFMGSVCALRLAAPLLVAAGSWARTRALRAEVEALHRAIAEGR
jgi:hypothetical protein